MGLRYNPSIVSDGLIVNFNAADKKSYSGSGTTWNDRIGGLSITNSDLEFNNENTGVISFSGTGGYHVPNVSNAGVELDNQTFVVWVKTETNMSTTTGGSFTDWILQWGNYYHNNSGGIGGQTGSFSILLKGSTTSGWSSTDSKTLSTTPYENGKWIMYTVKFVGNTNVVVCMDNTEIFDKTISDGYTDIATDIIYLKRGVMENKMGCFLVYDKVLSDAEIAKNFQAFSGRFGRS